MHTPDQHPATAFLRCLGVEETLLTEALAIADDVSAALRSGDIASAIAATTRQRTLAGELAAAGMTRTASANALAQHLDLPNAGLTLSLLAERLPAPFADDVRAARERLAGLTSRFAAVQTRNANLLGHLRSFFRGVLADLAPTDAPVRYGPSGSRV